MNEQEKQELALLKAKESRTDIENARIKELESKEVKQYTQAEIDAMLQSNSDKRVTDALAKAKLKFEEEFRLKLEEEKKETARLATLSAEEKAKEEIRKQKEELEAQKVELLKKTLKFDTITLLNEEKLPIHFADMLMGVDAESTNANIKAFKETYAKTIEDAVKERLAGKTPSSGSGGTNLNDKKLQDMTSFERIELKKNNPELYKKKLNDRNK